MQIAGKTRGWLDHRASFVRTMAVVSALSHTTAVPIQVCPFTDKHDEILTFRLQKIKHLCEGVLLFAHF